MERPSYQFPRIKYRVNEITKQLQELPESRRITSVRKYFNANDASPKSYYTLWRATGLLIDLSLVSLLCKHRHELMPKKSICLWTIWEIYLPQIYRVDGEAGITLRDFEKPIAALNPKKANGLIKQVTRYYLNYPV